MSKIKIEAVRITKGSKYAMFEELGMWKDGEFRAATSDNYIPFFVNFLVSSEHIDKDCKQILITIEEDD